MELWELFTAGRNTNGPTLEYRSAFFTKLDLLLLYIRNHTPDRNRELENLFPHRVLHRAVYSNSMHNCPNLASNKLSFSECVVNGMSRQ